MSVRSSPIPCLRGALCLIQGCSLGFWHLLSNPRCVFQAPESPGLPIPKQNVLELQQRLSPWGTLQLSSPTPNTPTQGRGAERKGSQSTAAPGRGPQGGFLCSVPNPNCTCCPVFDSQLARARILLAEQREVTLSLKAAVTPALLSEG